jgi:hypothetical protein
MPKAKRERIVNDSNENLAIVRLVRDAACELSHTSYFRDDFCRPSFPMRGWVVVPYADAPIDLSPLGVPKPPVWVARVRTGQAPDYVGSPDVSLVAGPSGELGPSRAPADSFDQSRERALR